MAEPTGDPTSFAIPPPVRITLPEAVDLIAGQGIDRDAVWNALLAALGGGRLSAGDYRPEYFRNLPYEQLALLGMPQADLDAIRAFGDIPPGSWRCWIAEDGSIIRTTGEVLRHIPGNRGLVHFRPWLSRNAVLVHFRVAEAIASPKPKLKDASNKTLLDAVRAVYNQSADREGPNVNKIVPLVQSHLQAQGYKASKLSIQDIAGSSEFDSKRREVGKHR